MGDFQNNQRSSQKIDGKTCSCKRFEEYRTKSKKKKTTKVYYKNDKIFVNDMFNFKQSSLTSLLIKMMFCPP
jgi:hypothetical protein